MDEPRTRTPAIAACRSPYCEGTLGMVSFLRKHMRTGTVIRTAAFCLSLGLLGQAGCVMQPTISLSVTTADGEKLDVPLNEAAGPATDGTMTVKVLQMSPWVVAKDKPKEITFSMIVEFVPGTVLKGIMIEDVTDTPIETIYEDPKAAVVKNNIWGAVSKPFAPQDEHVNWVLTVENSVRIYKFTAKLGDGTTHTVLKPMFVPSNVKEFMRTQLGLKASP
jgi:hypothetical protein